ncbi:hypothetical protein KR222_011204, partial [Zaprionus bogoriensis]
NGAYLRDRKSCRKFFICANGKAISRSCPKDLSFDIEKKVCNFPSLVKCVDAQVDEYSSKKHELHAIELAQTVVSESTTKLNIQQLKSNEDLYCRYLPNGEFLRDLQSCGKFYVCANGLAVPKSCPGVLYFDIKKKVCNFPDLVDCTFDNRQSYTATKSPSLHAVSKDFTEKVENLFIPDCSAQRNGVYIRDPKSCSKFYVCANGQAILRQCPKGLHIDTEIKYCDYPSRVNC